MDTGIGGHTRPRKGHTNDWITPPHILDALGEFDLDPCECLPQPWPCASRGFTIEDDGLSKDWDGRVYCNPPYGEEAWPFLERMADHGNGISLIFARTETKLFQRHVWNEADGILFLAGRLHFHYPDGTRARGNSGGPSILIGYGEENVDVLRSCGLPGALVTGWELQNMKLPKNGK
jgi:hypothetical protein